MISFKDNNAPLDDESIRAVEAELGLQFPEALLTFYRQRNGGEPYSCCFPSQNGEIPIRYVLPLDHDPSNGIEYDETIIEVYRAFNQTPSSLSPKMLPFAGDPGGDYVMVDCDSPNAEVYITQRDSEFEEMPVDPLNVGLAEFFDGCIEC